MFKPQKILTAIAACVLVLSCMAVCAGCQSEPKNAKEVFDKYASTAHNNYNMAGDIDIALTLSGMSMDMPISFNFDVNGSSTHGNVSMNILGTQADVEMYTVEQDGKLLSYTKSNASGGLLGANANSSADDSWTVTEAKGNAIEELTKLDASLFANADFSKSESGYTVTIKGKDLYNFAQKIASESGNDTAEGIATLSEEYVNFIDSLSIKCEFDKDCNLTSMSVPETKGTITMNNQTVDITAGGNLAITNQGKIGTITVPDDIVKSAKQSDSPATIATGSTSSSSQAA